MPGKKSNLHGEITNKKYFCKYTKIIFLAGFASQGVLNKDPIPWLIGRYHPYKYVCKFMNIFCYQVVYKVGWKNISTAIVIVEEMSLDEMTLDKIPRGTWVCSIKSSLLYRLRNKLAWLFVQAGVHVQTGRHQLTTFFFHFSVNYGFVMFYCTGPSVIKLFPSEIYEFS